MKGGKMAHIGFREGFILELGGGGLLFHYSVQDYSFETVVTCVVIKRLSPHFIKWSSQSYAWKASGILKLRKKGSKRLFIISVSWW